MKEMRTFLRFLSLTVMSTVLICCAQTQVDPYAEVQITELPLTPEVSKKSNKSKLSIFPSSQSANGKSKKSAPQLESRAASTDDIVLESEESILTPPALSTEVKKVEIGKVQAERAAQKPQIPAKKAPSVTNNKKPVTQPILPVENPAANKKDQPDIIEQTITQKSVEALSTKPAQVINPAVSETITSSQSEIQDLGAFPEKLVPNDKEPEEPALIEAPEVDRPRAELTQIELPAQEQIQEQRAAPKEVSATGQTDGQPTKPETAIKDATPPKKETAVQEIKEASQKPAQPKAPVKRRDRRKKTAIPSLESPLQVAVPELVTPEPVKEGTVITPDTKGQKLSTPAEQIPSMADAPITEEKKEFIKEGIETTLVEKQQKKEAREAFEKLTQKGTIHLGQYMEPWKGTDPNETVEMNFDNKELTELLKFLSNNLDVTFILDDYIEPVRADGLQPLAGTKISFKSNTPLTLKQTWDIGLTFLEMAGFSVIPATQPRTYRVTTSASRDRASANREPLPTFIGTSPEVLPDNDSKIRYVYFADNAELPTIVQIIDAMKSGSAGPLIEVPQLKAVIMTDKSANIKSLVSILQEIDRVTLPETLAIIRLRHTDARQVRELYHRLIGKDPSNPIFNPFARQRKPSTTQYFTEATRVFEEPRTNSLIVLGTRENIKRFEDFIIKYVDRTIDLPFSPLHIIQLKYIDAASIAKILNDVIQKFNSDPANTSAALVGGVRDSNKFFRPSVRVTEEPAGNRLIINADYEEYLKLREIIDKLDVEQPQVAIKVLILNVDLSNTETLGTQLRNKVDCCDHTGGLDSILGTNVNFQTNFIGPVVPNEPAPGSTLAVNGANRLLGNLINLANRVGGVSPFGIGTTLVTLGQDLFGFWGLLRALETYTRVSIVANPFMVITHKYKSEIRVGETRRTTTATVEGQRSAQAQGDIAADLRVIITPQISHDDMVTLNVYVELAQFTSTDPNNANRLIRKLSTEALLANKEVLALGGLIRDIKNEVTYKIPFLGDIPLLGWLFKNKTYYIERTSLLILIAPEIIKPYEPEVAEAFTFSKLSDAKDTLFKLRNASELRDPIHRWMFSDHKNKEASTIDKFVAMQQRYIDESQKKSEVIALNDSAKKSDKNGQRSNDQRSKGAHA